MHWKWRLLCKVEPLSLSENIKSFHEKYWSSQTIFLFLIGNGWLFIYLYFIFKLFHLAWTPFDLGYDWPLKRAIENMENIHTYAVNFKTITFLSSYGYWLIVKIYTNQKKYSIVYLEDLSHRFISKWNSFFIHFLWLHIFKTPHIKKEKL